jgi:hypothetical protein
VVTAVKKLGVARAVEEGRSPSYKTFPSPREGIKRWGTAGELGLPIIFREFQRDLTGKMMAFLETEV